jgi:hypothetical protein
MRPSASKGSAALQVLVLSVAILAAAAAAPQAAPGDRVLARSGKELKSGDLVRVMRREGLTLIVEPE